MKNVPLIRKRVLKEYLKGGSVWGFLIVLPFIMLALPQESVRNYIILCVLCFLIVYAIAVIYPLYSREFWPRKKSLNYVKNSSKYNYLDQIKFVLNEDLFFEGIYKDFYIEIIPMISLKKSHKYLNYDVISAIYDLPENSNNLLLETKLSGDYFFGNLIFENNYVSLIPKNIETPNFKETLYQLVLLLEREGFIPISKEDWEVKNKVSSVKTNV